MTLRLGNNEDLKANTLLFTNDTEEVLEEVAVVRDLGVNMDNMANFKHQRNAAIKRLK